MWLQKNSQFFKLWLLNPTFTHHSAYTGIHVNNHLLLAALDNNWKATPRKLITKSSQFVKIFPNPIFNQSKRPQGIYVNNHLLLAALDANNNNNKNDNNDNNNNTFFSGSCIKYSKVHYISWKQILLESSSLLIWMVLFFPRSPRLISITPGHGSQGCYAVIYSRGCQMPLDRKSSLDHSVWFT